MGCEADRKGMIPKASPIEAIVHEVNIALQLPLPGNELHSIS